MNTTIKMKDTLYIANTYRRYPVYAKYATGCNIIDDEGKEYIDFTSGLGVTNLGHSFEPWVDAVHKQTKNIEHCSNLFYSKQQVDLAEKLCQKTDMKSVFFTNSGTEANDAAIQIARKYAFDLYRGDRNEIITIKDGFHGHSIGTENAGDPKFKSNFTPNVDGFVHMEADNFTDLKTYVNSKTLAIMIEVVQYENGITPLAKSFLDAIQDICDHQDILLIIDEVKTGMGRCGSLFAYMHYGLHPDFVTCANGLGNGLPIGAVLMGDKCEDTLEIGELSSSTGGNPIAAAGANVVLDHMNESLYSHVNQLGSILCTKLTNFHNIESVNGLGLMLSATLKDTPPIDMVVRDCIEQGLLLSHVDNQLCFLPPLNIQEKDIDKVIRILEKVFDKYN